MDSNILDALRTVIDPELGVSVVDLGLVARAERVADRIEVGLGTTSPACPLGEMMVDDARRALAKSFPEATSIRVDLMRDFGWSPRRMSDAARRQLWAD